MKKTKTNSSLRIGIVVPHIFMHQDILPDVIFSPANLAFTLADGLQALGAQITLFTPGPVNTSVKNITADLRYFEAELAGRHDTYIELLKKHPFTFVTLARQVQSELIARAYQLANNNQLDIVHVYTNEEDIALPFSSLCTKPVVFTHHDPFNFLVKYKNLFPKYKHCNWISMSYAQRKGMPKDTNWVGNVYHGLSVNELRPLANPTNDYVAYLGRIVQPKGLHLAIQAIKLYNQTSPKPVTLKIAGKHYSGHKNDTYWHEEIEPLLTDPHVEYLGFKEPDQRQKYLGNAKSLLVPSLFEEPFGMVTIEALACGTPVIGLDSGALPEVIEDSITGFVVTKSTAHDGTLDATQTAKSLADAISRISSIDRKSCRAAFESRFTSDRMCQEHLAIYIQLIQ